MAVNQNNRNRTEKHNQVDNIRPDDGSTPKGVGSTDNMDEIKPRTTGSDQMASGSPAITQSQKNSSMTNQKAGGQGGQSKMNANDPEAVRRSVDEDAEKDTGRPTGAIHGQNFDEKAVRNDFNEKDSPNRKNE